MKIKYFSYALILSFCAAITTFAANISKDTLALQAVSSNSAESKQAISELRLLGKEGLEAVFTKYSSEIKKFNETGERTESWNRIAFALDNVAMQKDVYSSNLFWQTDMKKAFDDSAKSGKPILSLRLLGNLNEEFSCANSRLFRAVLYSNTDISKYLRENYILHWQSVRPAPKVTIDYGDGRKIERTITGNSIHYTLDAQGNIIDALPGLYNPQQFLEFLKASKTTFDKAKTFSGEQKREFYGKTRKQIFNKIITERNDFISKSNIKLSEPAQTINLKPNAMEAAPLAVTKMIVTSEISILNAVFDDFAKYQPQINLDDWNNLAKLYAKETKLDSNGLAFIKRQTQNTVNEKQFAELVENLEKYVALDSTRNDFLLRPQIYKILSDNQIIRIAQLNAQVYTSVFQTPDSDKWLGLYTPTIYTALDGNGINK